MKKELTFNASSFFTGNTQLRFSPKSTFRYFAGIVENSAMVNKLATLYSKLLEEPVSPRRTLHFVNAQVAAFLLLSACNASAVTLSLLTIWAGAAIYGCRNK